ncbi:hypothetical protein DESUT3_23210 [Desulfuromonas versatilis]|uniref:DUF304 domain-containing protein n=1 Tax=Desulfuromonas versatilis TaxID=2802975 RepID=A0ABN6DYN6_9BACT|nr:hypothetical protein [Desulfuromonas versatilis]BCR05252.1 hypothetical protein DESUT3_23210 [Desulfuromonas versatilis]
MDWSSYLEAGEVLRWEGRPAPRCFTFRNWKHSLFGILLLVLALYWQVVGYQLAKVYEAAWLGWMPLPFIIIALYLSVGHLVLARLEWEKVYYAVTDRRILALRGLRSIRFQSMPLAQLSYFRIKPLGESLGTVRVSCSDSPSPLVVCCIEHPRSMTDLLEEALRANGVAVQRGE